MERLYETSENVPSRTMGYGVPGTRAGEKLPIGSGGSTLSKRVVLFHAAHERRKTPHSSLLERELLLAKLN
jgi:hypothetical protein